MDLGAQHTLSPASWTCHWPINRLVLRPEIQQHDPGIWYNSQPISGKFYCLYSIGWVHRRMRRLFNGKVLCWIRACYVTPNKAAMHTNLGPISYSHDCVTSQGQGTKQKGPQLNFNNFTWFIFFLTVISKDPFLIFCKTSWINICNLTRARRSTSTISAHINIRTARLIRNCISWNTCFTFCLIKVSL